VRGTTLGDEAIIEVEAGARVVEVSAYLA